MCWRMQWCVHWWMHWRVYWLMRRRVCRRSDYHDGRGVHWDMGCWRRMNHARGRENTSRRRHRDVNGLGRVLTIPDPGGYGEIGSLGNGADDCAVADVGLGHHPVPELRLHFDLGHWDLDHMGLDTDLGNRDGNNLPLNIDLGDSLFPGLDSSDRDRDRDRDWNRDKLPLGVDPGDDGRDELSLDINLGDGGRDELFLDLGPCHRDTDNPLADSRLGDHSLRDFGARKRHSDRHSDRDGDWHRNMHRHWPIHCLNLGDRPLPKLGLRMNKRGCMCDWHRYVNRFLDGRGDWHAVDNRCCVRHRDSLGYMDCFPDCGWHWYVDRMNKRRRVDDRYCDVNGFSDGGRHMNRMNDCLRDNLALVFVRRAGSCGREEDTQRQLQRGEAHRRRLRGGEKKNRDKVVDSSDVAVGRAESERLALERKANKQ